MASVDERVVAMSFENTRFEAGVAHTHATLLKLDSTIANIGKVNGLSNIERAASKVTLQTPMSALDKLRSRLFGASQGAAEGLGGIERAGNKVTMLGPISALDKLRSRLFGASQGAAEGFNGIEKASDKVTLRGLNSAVDSVKVKLGGLQTAGAAAVGTISSIGTQKVGAALKGFSLGPITAGLQEYTTNLNSIQTILANTKDKGSNLDDVNAALQNLNTYSDKTIYNFGQMARNIGTFTAAGVDLKTSVQSIKGIANLAALSGSNSEQASTAMYQLSQAIASGKVGLQDWNSVVNAGMGGAVFQKALIRTGQALGTIEKGAVKIDKATGKATINGQSFRESIMAAPGKKSWLSSEVLTGTLQQFTGDLTTAQLKAKGFNDEQIKAIQQSATSAKQAATQVKTLGQVFDIARETIGSGWSKTFQTIFGDFGQAKKTFTDLSNSINGVINDSAKARNKMLGDWKKLGGRQVLIEGIKDLFKSLGTILEPLHDAFREIFPKSTGKQLFELTTRFREFAKALAIGPETAEKLKRTFAGFFALLHIGTSIIKGIASVFFHLLGVAGHSSGGFLAITASIGDFIVAVDKAISQGQGLEGIFKGLAKILEAPIHLISAIGRSIQGLFGDSDPGAADNLTSALEHLEKELGPLGTALEAVIKVWKKFFEVLKDIGQFLQPILEDVQSVFSKIGDAVTKGLEGVDYDKVMTAIQTVFIGGLAVGVKKLLGGIGIDLTGGLVGKLKGVLTVLEGGLSSIQRNVNAQTMLLIAAAAVALAGAALIFSKIDGKELAKSMAAIAVGLAELSGVILLLSKFTTGVVALPIIAASMVLLATAVDILAIAVFAMSKLSWEELAKGLLGVAGALVAIGVAAKVMSGPQLLLIGPALIPIAFALNLIAVAMKLFSSISWEGIAKGLVGIGGALLIIGLATKVMGPSLLLVGPGLIALSLGLILLSGAVSSFGSMDLGSMAKGILGIAAALIVIGLAISVIPPTIGLQAAGLILLGIALNELAVAIALMGAMGIGTIAKGLLTMGAALIIFAVGLTAMSGAAVGAASLMAAALAFAVLTPVLVTLGQLKWGTIVKGLVAMAATIAVLAIAGALASPLLAALGAALLVLGGAAIVSATAFYIMAKAFALLGDQGTKGVSVMIAALTAFIVSIPKLVITFVKGLVEILAAVVKLAPQIAESLVKIATTFLTAFSQLIPKIAVILGQLVTTIANVAQDHGPALIAAGLHLFLAFLKGLSANIGTITTHVGHIISSFLSALATQMPRIISSGARLLGNFLTGIVNHLPRLITLGARAVNTFLDGVSQHLPSVVRRAGTLAVTFLNSVASQIPRMARAGTNLIVAFLGGVANNIGRVIRAGVHVIRRVMFGMARAIPELADAAAKALVKFLDGLSVAIHNNAQKIHEAGVRLAKAIIEGMVTGLLGEKNIRRLKSAIHTVGKIVPKFMRRGLLARSPARVMIPIGKDILAGVAVGIQKGTGQATGAITRSADDIVGTAENTLGKLPNLLDGIADTNPVITPVLDLSAVKQEAKQISDLTSTTPITANASLDQAAIIAQAQTAVQAAKTEQAAQASAPVLKFEQHNNSPESLSTIEIYRRTNNLLSQAKRQAGIAVPV